MKKLLIVFICLIFFALIVNAEIVSPSCERKATGKDNFILNCYSNPVWIKDLNGEWADFNSVVSFNFNEENRNYLVEWNENQIEINIYGIYKGNKYYFKDIPESIWNDLNFSQTTLSEKGKYKFGVKVNKIKFLTEIGFDLVSSTELTEIDANNLFFKFKDIGVGFWDLIENFEMIYLIDGNIITIKTAELPDLDELDLDPEITLNLSNNEDLKKRVVPPPFPSETYTCRVKLYRVRWDYVPGTASDEWRGLIDFTSIGLPSNAIIEKVEFRAYTYSNSLPSGQYVLFKQSPLISSGNCATRFDAIGNGTQYTVRGRAFFSVGQYYEWVDLGEDAVNDLQGHLTYFAVGKMVQNTSSSDESWDGEAEWLVSTNPQLRITYSVPPEKEEYVESWLENKLRKGEPTIPQLWELVGFSIAAITLSLLIIFRGVSL